MTNISTRHIPLAFDTWIFPQGKSRPETLCGVRTVEKYMGIPGITQQAEVVYRDGTPIWGWCASCAYEFNLRLFPPHRNSTNTPMEIFDLHARAGKAIEETARFYERERT